MAEPASSLIVPGRAGVGAEPLGSRQRTEPGQPGAWSPVAHPGRVKVDKPLFL